MTLEDHLEALPEMAALHKWANGWKVGYRTFFIVRSVYCEHRIEDRERWVDSSFQIYSAPTPLEALERFAEWQPKRESEGG